MYDCSIYLSYVEISSGSPSEDEAVNSVILYLVKKAEPLHNVRSLILLSHSTLQSFGFEDLAVVPSSLSHQPHHISWYCERMAADAAGIHGVGFIKSVFYPCILRDISVGHSDIPKLFFRSIVDRPSHN